MMPEQRTLAEENAEIEARDGWRLYLLLALFDARDGEALSEMVRTAREGYERSGPEMNEDDAWAPFDRIWDSFDSAERLAIAKAAREAR